MKPGGFFEAALFIQASIMLLPVYFPPLFQFFRAPAAARAHPDRAQYFVNK